MLQNLLKRTGGYTVKYPNLQFASVEVAKRCAGLSILLGNIARALKDGDLSEGKDALEKLKKFNNG